MVTKKVWTSFNKAREFVRSLKLRNRDGWYEYCKSGERPDDIPANPGIIYKNDGWKDWVDWLGNEDRIKVFSEEGKKKISETLKCRIISEEYKIKISEAGKKSWRPFDEAREFARSLQLKNTREWEEYRNSGKKPDDIPSHPNVIYKNDWIGWIDW